MKINQSIALTNEELEQLKGGDNIPGSTTIGTINPGDITNLNLISGCGCTYNNMSVIINRNEVKGCSCVCK